MKILIATGLYPPDIGGPATYTALAEKELKKRGIEVAVLPFTKYREMPKWKRHFRYYNDLKKIAWDVDIIYAQDTVSVGLPAALVAKKFKKKFVIRVAGDYAWEQSAQRFGVKESVDDFQKKSYLDPRIAILRFIQRWVVEKANLVITPSNYFRNLVSRWIKNPEKVRTVYNGIEFEDYEKRNPEGYRVYSILSAGRLVPWKGFDFLIKLMPKLQNWRSLWIAGDGPDKERLEELIEKYGEGRVYLNPEKRDTLKNTADTHDLFILNTSFESFSFQVVEMMHAGVPVITTNIGSLPELIKDGEEGLLVEPNNEEQLLAAINKLEDANFRKKIIENAKKKSLQFTVESTVNNLEKLLWSLK